MRPSDLARVCPAAAEVELQFSSDVPLPRTPGNLYARSGACAVGPVMRGIVRVFEKSAGSERSEDSDQVGFAGFGGIPRRSWLASAPRGRADNLGASRSPTRPITCSAGPHIAHRPAAPDVPPKAFMPRFPIPALEEMYGITMVSLSACRQSVAETRAAIEIVFRACLAPFVVVSPRHLDGIQVALASTGRMICGFPLR
jgi:hypothetical protein